MLRSRGEPLFFRESSLQKLKACLDPNTNFEGGGLVSDDISHGLGIERKLCEESKAKLGTILGQQAPLFRNPFGKKMLPLSRLLEIAACVSSKDKTDIFHTVLSTLVKTQATVGGSPFGPFISVARGHSRE